MSGPDLDAALRRAPRRESRRQSALEAAAARRFRLPASRGAGSGRSVAPRTPATGRHDTQVEPAPGAIEVEDGAPEKITAEQRVGTLRDEDVEGFQPVIVEVEVGRVDDHLERRA